jgi:ferredoxin-nitrite reductase
VGGKQGSGGFVAARSLNVFVERELAAELAAQITLLFRDHGSRESRARARLAFLIDEWGVEKFRSALVERLGFELERAGQSVQSTHQSDHLGVTPQAQLGRYAVGLAVPVGRISAEQVDGLADLAESYGTGEIRITPGQNMVVPNVPDRLLTTLLSEPLLEELRPDPAPSTRGTVSCIGTNLCDLALTDTKGHALDVAHRLEMLPTLRRPISINWSGCPASCGNHHLATIGLQGGKSRMNGEVTEVYQVFAGGQSGPMARQAVPVVDTVPAAEIHTVIERLALAHAGGHDVVAVGREIAAERGQAMTPEAAETVA